MSSREELLSKVEKVRALDIKLYRYAVWCTFKDGEPFWNPIVHRSWAEDGERIWFGFESHNTLMVLADAMVEVLPLSALGDTYNTLDFARIDARDAAQMVKRPPRKTMPDNELAAKRELGLRDVKNGNTVQHEVIAENIALRAEVERLKVFEERDARAKAILRDCGFDLDEMRKEAAKNEAADPSPSHDGGHRCPHCNTSLTSFAINGLREEMRVADDDVPLTPHTPSRCARAARISGETTIIERLVAALKKADGPGPMAWANSAVKWIERGEWKR